MSQRCVAPLAFAFSSCLFALIAGCGPKNESSSWAGPPVETAAPPAQPQRSPAHEAYLRGYALFDKAEWDKAIAEYDEAIRLDPKFARAVSERGHAKLNAGRVDAAIPDFDEAIRLDPKDEAAFGNRGQAWYAKKEYDKALRDFDEAIRIDPKNAAFINNRGFVRAAKRQWDEAIKDYDEAIRLNPKYAEAFENRALARSAKGESEKAIRDYDEAIRLNPKLARAWQGRAYVRSTCADERYRDGKKAIEDARQACELTGWKDSEYFATLAGGYAEDGQFEEAVKWQKKAMEDESYRRKYNTFAEHLLTLYQNKMPFRDKKK